MQAYASQEDRLYHDPELVQFYDLDNESRDDFGFCLNLAADAGSVLDLGCGTGQLAVELAPGRSVVGVDPATAMLEMGLSRPGGHAVQWVAGDARDLRLGRTFDLILLTGHAFQCFLTAEDQQAVLETIAAHLATDGRFIFDSRNPHHREWLEWTPDLSLRSIEHPDHGTVTAHNDVSFDPLASIVTYQTFYEAQSNGRRWTAESHIAFPAQDKLEEMIHAVGLSVERWMGDWHGSPFTPASPEIIPIGRLA